MCRSRRMLPTEAEGRGWITSSEICIIFYIALKLNSIIVLLFIREAYLIIPPRRLSSKLCPVCRHCFRIYKRMLFLADTAQKVKKTPSCDTSFVFLHVFRSVLVRNSAISSLDSRERLVISSSLRNKKLGCRAWKGGSMVYHNLYHRIDGQYIALPNMVSVSWELAGGLESIRNGEIF